MLWGPSPVYRLQGEASLAGAIPGRDRIVGMGKILDVFRFGFSSRARGPTEYAGGFDREHEHAFVARIPIDGGLVHLLLRWQGGDHVHSLPFYPGCSTDI